MQPGQITTLKPATHNDKRINVFLDGKFAFSLDLAQITDFKLKVGQILSEPEITKLKKASNFGKLYQRTLEWVLTKPRSVKETKDYLTRKKFQKPEYGITDEDITAVLTRLTAKNYLNDVNFTTYYIENRQQTKGISLKKLRLELIKKGISPSLIDQSLKQATRDDTTEITKIIIKKRRQAKYQDDTKLIQYLVRQGFDYELAKNSVLETDSQN